MKVIDKIAWLELKEGKILSTRSKGRTKYYLPGGKREAGETDSQTLCREIKEELSLELLADSLQFLKTFKAQADSHPDGVQVQMTCYAGSYKGSIVPANEIEEVVWLNYSHRDQVSAVDQMIFDWLKARGELQ